MNDRIVRSLALTLSLGSASALSIASLVGCGRGGNPDRIELTRGTAALRARGTVEIEKLEPTGTRFELNVHQLNEPSAVNKPASVYVVWVKPEGDAAPMNVGVLPRDKGMDAEFEGTTPHARFDVWITAEPSGDVTVPSMEPALRASIRR